MPLPCFTHDCFYDSLYRIRAYYIAFRDGLHSRADAAVSNVTLPLRIITRAPEATQFSGDDGCGQRHFGREPAMACSKRR